MTIRTTVDKKPSEHTIVIAGDLARSTSEYDTWRLFDTKANTVTFVDDVGRTVRTEPLSSLLKKRQGVDAAELPAHYPHATFARTEDRKPLLGTNAEKVTITSGGYTRELWLAEHPSIPPQLFAMMHVSETPSSPLAPMMRDVDRALVAVRGFPLLDRTKVPLGKGELVVERAVVGISQRDVPESLLQLPKGYEDKTNGRATTQGLAGGAGRKD